MPDLNLDRAGLDAAQRRTSARTMAASGRVHFWQPAACGSAKDRVGRPGTNTTRTSLRWRSRASSDSGASGAGTGPSSKPPSFRPTARTSSNSMARPWPISSSSPRAPRGGLSKRSGAPGIRHCRSRGASVGGPLLGALRANADADAMRAALASRWPRWRGPRLPRPSRTTSTRGWRAPGTTSGLGSGPLSHWPTPSPRHPVTEPLQAPVRPANRTSFRADLLWLRINVAIEAAMAGALDGGGTPGRLRRLIAPDAHAQAHVRDRADGDSTELSRRRRAPTDKSRRGRIKHVTPRVGCSMLGPS